MAGTDGNGDQVKGRVHSCLRILENIAGELYIDPDAQHYGDFRCGSDILGVYSREIEALRRLTDQLVRVCTQYALIVSGRVVVKPNRIILDEINMYLEAASWNMTLMLDPEGFSSSPD